MSNVLQKGDKVLNTKTNRFVKVGGPSWKKLVLEGVLEGAYKEANASKPLSSELVFDEELENPRNKKKKSNYIDMAGE